METIATKTPATPKRTIQKYEGAEWQPPQEIPLEERTDLTYEEIKVLGVRDPYEIIDGRIIFKMANPIHAYFQTEISYEVRHYLKEHLPTGDEPQTLAPDLAIEIVSDSFLFLDLVEKADLFISKGTKIVWLVIPARGCVLVWMAHERRWEYETLTCPELLPEFSLDLKKFFVQPQPQATS